MLGGQGTNMHDFIRRITWALNPNPAPNMLGIQSFADKEKATHIIMIDYDKINYENMEKDVKNIQEKYCLSDFYIFKTNKGFHAYCLDIMPFLDAFCVIWTSKADELYKIYQFKKIQDRCWTLRISQKKGNEPQYIGIIESKHNMCKKSLGHAYFLRTKGVPIDESKLMETEKTNALFVKYYQKVF